MIFRPPNDVCYIEVKDQDGLATIGNNNLDLKARWKLCAQELH